MVGKFIELYGQDVLDDERCRLNKAFKTYLIYK